jgi:hypothetical protein
MFIYNQDMVGTEKGKAFKGQLISKCPFGAYHFDKNTNKFFLRISALASKKR